RLLFCLYFFLLWLYTVKVEKQPFLLWKDRNQPFSFYLFQPAVLLIVVVAGSGVITYLLSFFGINQVSSSINELHQISQPARLLGVVVAAVFEELIFRAYLIPRLYLFFKSTYPPVLIAALLFGLGHAGYGTFSNIFVPLFAGLVYGFHYQRYRNIKVLIIFHFLFDYLALLT
ncbi:MAG: CPBP family intramembrane metalloprotease, partial [Sphingobacteriaceae bacterium]